MYGVPDFYQNDNVKKGTGMQWRHQVVSDLPIRDLLFFRTFSCVYTRNSPLGCITCKCVVHAAFNLKRVPV